MVFSSVHFVFYFLPIFLLVYSLTPNPLKKYLLILGSLYFYAWGAPVFILTVLLSCVVDFYLIRLLRDNPRNKKILLLSLFFNITILLYFKYANFFVENINFFLHTTLPWKEVLLPIGISFFTFQKISYLVDVYYEKEKPLQHFSDYLLYILLFPQLIAGPIVRFNDIHSQLISFSGRLEIREKLEGVIRFSLGLGKKVLIANAMGAIVVGCKVGDFGEMNTSIAWLMAFAYSFQLYFDFSGYSDMAIGLGKIVGFRFPENFNFPYLSGSITEFWQRWHITLGNWMRDYLYIPLGGNRVSSGRVYLNLLIVFFLSGFWHGAAWGFVIWGLYHGLFLVIERLYFHRILSRLPRFITIGYTFMVVTLGWLFFDNGFTEALKLLKLLFTELPSFEIISKIDYKSWLFLLAAVLITFGAYPKIIQEKLSNLSASIVRLRPSRMLVPYLLVLSVLFWSLLTVVAEGFNPFIYYRF
jgi:alginate O-acetyltransferase complex protein AlgI